MIYNNDFKFNRKVCPAKHMLLIKLTSKLPKNLSLYFLILGSPEK